MNGNIKVINWSNMVADGRKFVIECSVIPVQSETLQELAINESKEKKPVATEGMMWLLRYTALNILVNR